MADGEDGVVVEPGDEGSTIPPFKMPSAEDLLAAIEKMGGLSDADREQLRDGVLRRQKGADNVGPLPQEQGVQGAGVQFIMLLTWISLIALVFAFFGYKLYKSLVERERRREEKKRQKQQKKKK